MVRIIDEQDKHLRNIICDCCESKVEYGVNDIEIRDSESDGVSGICGFVVLKMITCPHCKNIIYLD